jgi:hypothetical protein
MSFQQPIERIGGGAWQGTGVAITEISELVIKLRGLLSKLLPAVMSI